MIELAQALARTAITIRPRLSLSQDLRLRPRLNRCLFGLGPPLRFPLGVSRALILLGLALHSPLPCLQNLFLLIHLSRYRLRDHHLCSLSGHRVRVVRRPSGPGSELEGSHAISPLSTTSPGLVKIWTFAYVKSPRFKQPISL